MLFRLALLGALLAVQAHCAVLVPTASSWRWRPGTNEASTPVTAWRLNGFNDSQFTTAPAPFWYGDVLPGGTEITGMQNFYSCIFLRKTFVVNNLAEIGGLRLASLVDDGFVAWINGTEVARVSMPGSVGDPVTTNTLASNAIEPVSFVTNDLPVPPTYLVVGTNVLAVQVFQSALNSSDLGFECALESVVAETIPPTVASVNPAPGTITNLTSITVTFSEPVTGVAEAHLRVNGFGATSFTAIDSSTYTFNFVQPPYGNVAISWSANHNIYDQALPPNRFDETGPGTTWNYTLIDNTTPQVAALTPSTGATVRSLNSVTVFFSEGVTGVNASDLLINNTPAAGVTPATASQYIFTFPEPPTGAVQVAWAAGHGIVDTATPPNAFAGGNWTYNLDPNSGDVGPYISEFMALNTRTNGVGSLIDEDRESSDWIEIYNPSGIAVNLDGWYLTDSAGNLTKWRFPATNLAGGGFLIVFASGKDRRVPGARLHANFALAAGGEYLALVKPDGVTVASAFAPAYSAQVPDVSHGYAQSGSPPGYTTSTESVYFTTATPGAANLGGTAVPGPVIEDVKHTPNVPLDHEDLLVTARVRPSFRAVGSVTMRYRIMFSNEVTTTMFDDGAHGDGAAGDGVYGATIPANLSTNGQMIRYFIAATDVNANASRWPLYTSPTATAQYLGTIVDPTNVTSKLPIFHLFAPPTILQPPRINPATQQIGADSETGGRVSIFYDGEFYDNVYMEIRGNTSAGQNKKSHRLEFNREHAFRHLPGYPRLVKTSLMAEFLDPAYIRQHLCFWLLDQMGVPSPFFYPVRAQLNGSFYGLVFHNDVIGQEQVERMGYDPKGALYKAAGNVLISRSSTGVFQKLEPDGPPDYTDYNQLCNGIVETATPANRRIAVFDQMDVPEVINYLAGARWCAENDDVWANMSIYRDTFGDQLWRIIPFDMNASWGQRYGGITPLDTIADTCKSHPLYGGSTIIACDGGTYNRIYDVIIALPETRQMLLRRQRTVLDRWVLEPGVAPESRLLESHIRHMTNLIWTEAFLDRASWGYSTWTASNKPLTNAITELFNQFINLRRNHFNGTHCVTNTAKTIGITPNSNAGIPVSQPANVSLTIAGVEFNPSGGNQEQEFVCVSNPAPFAVDISGWKLEGGINFTFKPGTVMPSNGVAYVSPNTRQFRARTSGPRGGQGLFVLGPYKGQLSARGETITIKNGQGLTLRRHTYTGAPSPLQQSLRITEIMFHPSAVSGNPTLPDEFEYMELRNISTTATLNLSGVRFINGIEFNFTGSAITSLAPGARVLVVKNAAAFASRYGNGLPVAGQYVGNLDNDGERIQLLDANNEEILDFSYSDAWYPLTDGLGFSLVVADEAAEPDLWNNKSQWRPSGTLTGTPGQPEATPPTFAPVLISEALSRSDTPPPTDTIELHNPTAQPADISGWWLTDDFNAPKKYRIPSSTVIVANGYVTFNEAQFNPGGAGFALSSDSDEVWLFSADSAGNLTGYVHGHAFGAADDGVSFGRHLTSEGKEHFVAQTTRTLGAANAGPRVGPVIINEIMYRPPDLGGTNDNSDDEFIELLNVSTSPVPLFDTSVPTNTWRLRGGVDFDFPANVILAVGEYVFLVNFHPTNLTMATAFRTKYGLGAGVRLFGPYEGKLDNSSDNVELKKPTTAVAGVVPYVLMDKVDYRDSTPWPGGADGFGLSLQRRSVTAYGNDPASWVAAPPTPAAPTQSGGIPTITAHPQGRTLLAFQPVAFSVTATGDGPLRYQWRLNGALLAGATNATLSLASAQPGHAGDYDVLVFNTAGSVVSSNATLSLFYPASILSPPASVVTRPGSNVTFSVAAYSGGPLNFQWKKNGANVPGGNSATLSLPNVQLIDAGEYVVEITDEIGTTMAPPATLTILIDPLITQHPVSVEIVPGETVVLSISVTNTATLPIGYRLRRNNLTIPATVPGAYTTLNERTLYLTLSGTNTMPPWVDYGFIVTNLARPTGLLATSALITYLPDTDGDRLPDGWESQYFGAAGANPTADSDNDGLTNAEEYTAGTDPTNASSYLRIDSIRAAGTAALTFGAVSNKTYTVQYTDRLGSGLWRKLLDVPARETNHVETLVDTGFTTNRFYRLVTPRQP